MKQLELETAGGIPGYLIEGHREAKPRKLSSKDWLYIFIKNHSPVKTSDCIKFASDHSSNRGDRDARQLATQKEGRKIRRMSKERKAMIYGNIQEDVWEINPDRIVTEDRPLRLRMTDGYGIVNIYKCKDECPHCGGKIVNIRDGEHACYDGEWTHCHRFDCENGCLIKYGDMRRHNGYND